MSAPRVRSRPRAGVCVVMGWMGSVDASVAKYSALYENLGLSTLRFTCPTRMLLRNPNALDALAQDVLDSLGSNTLAGDPIFFHSLSNGGCLVYLALSRLLSREGHHYGPLSLRISGTVFDSAPARIHVTSTVKAFSRALPLESVARVARVAADVAAPVTRVLDRVYDRKGRSSRIVREMVDDEMGCRQLFLYSTADSITDHEPIDELVAERRRKGIDVRAVRWNDSEHVAHFLSHRKEYRDAVASLVRGDGP